MPKTVDMEGKEEIANMEMVVKEVMAVIVTRVMAEMVDMEEIVQMVKVETVETEEMVRKDLVEVVKEVEGQQEMEIVDKTVKKDNTRIN
jgi:hypothetical protein